MLKLSETSKTDLMPSAEEIKLGTREAFFGLSQDVGNGSAKKRKKKKRKVAEKSRRMNRRKRQWTN